MLEPDGVNWQLTVCGRLSTNSICKKYNFAYELHELYEVYEVITAKSHDYELYTHTRITHWFV